MGSYTKEFTTTKSGTYSGLYGVKLTITNTFTASTNKSKVKITKVEFKDPYTRNAPLYGKAYIGNTSTVVADYEGGSSQINTSAGSYVSCPTPSATEVEVQHDSNGDASITVGILKSSSLSGDFFGVRYSSGNWGVDTPKSATVTISESAPYSITYNANGGSGAPSSQAVFATYSYSLSATSPTRTGYTFKGWATSSSATTAQYQPSASVTISGNLALYAVWKINTWTVSYNANGHGTAPASQTKTYNVSLTLQQFISNQTGSGTTSNYTVTGNANGGTWSGSNGSATKKPNYTYSQTYWNTNSGGTGTNYSSKGAYTANSAATLYAIWKTTTSYSYTYTLPTGTPTKNQSVTVTFNANGGSTTKSSQSSTRAMTFNGWYTAASGGTKRTTSSQISANETVYAQYGNGTSAYPNVVLPTAAQCTRTGYNLLGFAASSSATTATYAPGAAYTPTATTTLYAVWQKKTYTLSLTKSDAGILVNANRTSSPIGGASTGLLSNGATLYYNDVIKVSWSVNSGYTAQTLKINNVDVSAYSPPEKTETITANLTIVMTVELGALVYIDTEAYQAFLDDGASYSQYEAYIDNGASWDAY